MAFDLSAAGAAGSARMKQIAAENKVEIDALIAQLLADLERPVTGSDRVLAEVVASATVRGRRLRAQGKDDRLERQQIATLLHNFPSLRAEHRAAELAADHSV